MVGIEASELSSAYLHFLAARLGDEDERESVSAEAVAFWDRLEAEYFLPLIEHLNGARDEDLPKLHRALGPFAQRFGRDLQEFGKEAFATTADDVPRPHEVEWRDLAQNIAETVAPALGVEGAGAVRFSGADIQRAMRAAARFLEDPSSLNAERVDLEDVSRLLSGLTAWLFGLSIASTLYAHDREAKPHLRELVARYLSEGGREAYKGARGLQLALRADEPAGAPAEPPRPSGEAAELEEAAHRAHLEISEDDRD